MMRYLPLAVLLFAASAASAMPVEDALKQSRKLAAAKKYDQALSVLKQAEKEHPEDLEVKLATVRVLSWQGKYSAAEARLAKLKHKDDANADVQLLRGNLAYYRKNYAAAEHYYRTILAEHPEYTDAKAALARVEKAKAPPVIVPKAHESHAAAVGTPAVSSPHNWQLDVGYEHSSFSRVHQPSWNQEFAQLNRFFNDRATAVHGKITRYDQFSNIDTEYEVGADHRFAEYLNGYVYGAFSPSADFRPERRAGAGGMIRVVNPHDLPVPIWLTLDSRYDIYSTVKVVDINPGIRIEPVNGWAIAARKISVDADNAKRVYGEDYRLDGTVIDTLRFYVGLADAPETEAAVTVNTKTYYGGIAWDMNDDMTLRLGYTHDDRENSYVREVVNASVSSRF